MKQPVILKYTEVPVSELKHEDKFIGSDNRTWWVHRPGRINEDKAYFCWVRFTDGSVTCQVWPDNKYVIAVFRKE